MLKASLGVIGPVHGVIDMTWILEFDYMRGFAILAVIAIHVSMLFPVTGTATILSTLNMLVYVQLQFAVPMFIFISGFVLALRYSGAFSAAAFYRRRLMTILPPYAVFTFVYMMVPAGVSGVARAAEVPSVQTFVFDLLTGSAYYHLWFFLIIIQLYLLYPLIAGLYSRSRDSGMEYLLLVALLGLQIIWDMGSVIASSLWSGVMIRTFVDYIFYFVLGIHVCYNFGLIREQVNRVSGKRIFSATAAITGLLSLFWIAGFVQTGTFEDIHGVYFLIESAAAPFYYGAIFVLAFVIAERLKVSAKAGSIFLKKTGNYSFGIYLVHPLLIAVGAEAIRRTFGINWDDWLFYPAVFVFTLALSYVSVLLLSHLPLGGLIVGTRAQKAKTESRPQQDESTRT